MFGEIGPNVHDLAAHNSILVVVEIVVEPGSTKHEFDLEAMRNAKPRGPLDGFRTPVEFVKEGATVMHLAVLVGEFNSRTIKNVISGYFTHFEKSQFRCARTFGIQVKVKHVFVFVISV